MSDDAGDYSQLLQDQLAVVEALHEIVMTSEEAEIVRTAMSALTSTQAGLAYLRTHPITM